MTLELSTAQDVFLIIVTLSVALFFVAGAIMFAAQIFLVSKIKKVVKKAEVAIDSVEAASETIKNLGSKAGGPLAVFKLIASIVEGVKKK